MSYIALSVPGVYVPPSILANADLEKIVDTTDEWIVSHTGIKERRISHDMGVRRMAVLAAQDLLEKTKCSPEEIDEVICAINRHDGEREFPAHAGHVARQIGAKKDIPFHDSGAGCTGLIYAVREAYNTLFTERGKKKILVVGSEHLSAMTDYSDRKTCILFGDGAGAYLLERQDSSEQEGIIKNIVGGLPDSDNLTLAWKQGKKLRPADDQAQEKFTVYGAEQNYLVMDGQKVFRFAAPAMSRAVHDIFEGTQYSLKDLDLIIPHGANIRIIRNAEENLRAKGFKGTIFTNLERYGNTSTASIPIAAAEAIQRGILKKGSLYVIVAFGAGLTWGASLVRHE